MVLDYSFKPIKQKVIVGFYDDSGLDHYRTLSQQIAVVAEQYDIQVVDNLIDHSLFDDCLIKHAIVLPKSSNPIEASQKYEYLLNWYQTMSLGMSYPNEKTMLSWRTTIEELKESYQYKINYLRPDMKLQNSFCVGSLQKILDNVVCDTVRVKYKPVIDLTYQFYLPPQIKQYFLEIAKIYLDYKLYHRAATDGFISIRYGSGFFITATKTNKDPLDLERISYVHHYDEARNEIFYSGKYLPSSDVVEAALVYRDNPNITALVHTHASDLFTRNSFFKSKIKVGRASYGVPELGRQINNVIQEFYDDFIIMEEHGEVFALTGDIKNCSNKMHGIISRTLKLTPMIDEHAEVVG